MIIRNTNLLVENLYYLLWLKDSGLKDASFNVKIPDTIILQSGKIMNWFFTSKNGEGILMKKDFNLKNTKIFESFTRNESKSRIVAMFIENIRNDDEVSEENLKKTKQNNHNEENIKFDIPKNEGQIVIRYLTKEKLKEFLFTDFTEKKSGILQKFIDPYGDSQSVIQAIWSPQLCIFSKRVNYRHLYDKRYDPYERLPTFDGAEMYSRTVPLRGKVISQEMRKFCENIVQRIAHVSFQKIMIQRMVVYFKPDKNNNLYFLYCSSMRLHGEKIDPDILEENQYKIKNTPLILDTNYQRPEEIKLIQTTNTMRPISLENNIQCFYCQQKIQKKDLVAVTYEFIINNFEENPNAKYSKVSSTAVLEVPKEQNFILNTEESHYVKDKTSEIPELLTKLYPKLTVENYHKLRQNKKFLSQKIRLCQYCYLDFSRYIKMSGAPLKGVEDFKFMKKGLAKKGSLFTREMKAIVAAKNVEMAEQKGAEFVKYQKREVYQRMLDYLVEEMEIIQREKKKKGEPNLQTLYGDGEQEQESEEEIKQQQKQGQFKIQKSQALLKPALKRPQSCKNFNQELKLKEIQKQIQLFDDKMCSQQRFNNLQRIPQSFDQQNQSPPRQKSKEYLDRDYLEKNQFDEDIQNQLIESNNTNINSNKYLNPEKIKQQTQLECQYKLNAQFIKTKKSQLSINSSVSLSKNVPRQMFQRPQSTTFNSSHQRINLNSTKDTHPQSGNLHQKQAIENDQQIISQNINSKNQGFFHLNKPYRIQTATIRQNQQQSANIGINGSISTIKSPQSTKYTSQSALQSSKYSQPFIAPYPQQIQFSNLKRPQSHQVFSNPSKPLSPLNEQLRIQTDNSQKYYNQEKIQQNNQRGLIDQPENEIIVEQNYDENENYQLQEQDEEQIDYFNYENLDFDFEEVNEDYVNQRD
ncbi:hypothetical protein ABPG72_003852 [Tetrahymena utriculariae]